MVVGKQSSEIAGKGAKFFGCGFLARKGAEIVL